MLKIRLLDGTTFTRTFRPSASLKEVLAAVHFSGHRLSSQKAYKLAAPMMGVNASDMGATLESQGVTRGVYSLIETS